MNEYKVENYRHPELKLRADSQFKRWEEGQTSQNFSEKGKEAYERKQFEQEGGREGN